MIKLKAHPGGFEGVLFRENNVDQEGSLEKDKRVKRDELYLKICDLVVWGGIGNQQALPHKQVGLVHLHKARLGPWASNLIPFLYNLDVSEGFWRSLPEVCKLLLQSPGSRHSSL